MQIPQPAYRAGIDVGGTFTDIVLSSTTGELWIKKVLSSPDNYADAILTGLLGLVDEHKIPVESISEICHGSTAATNAVLERKGAVVGLITTNGFRDVLELRRLRTPVLYNPFYRPPPPLVPRNLRVEVNERISAAGEIIAPLSEKSVQKAVDQLLHQGVNSIAISLINSYVNPIHEKMVANITEHIAPNLFVSLSSAVVPGAGEYERTSTVVANAYVKPLMTTYIASLKKQLLDRKINGPLFIMQSNGGMMTSSIATQKPVVTLESGPAAGVAAGEFTSKQISSPSLVTFDMGGTTTKAALIENGKAYQSVEYDIGAPVSQRSRLYRTGGYPLMIRAIDLAEVGAGGGSIIHINMGGSLTIGPQSAGSNPGPICYGLGGSDPTITDANLLLGYLNPKALAGTSVSVDYEKPAFIFDKDIASPLKLNVLEAAYGAHTIANSTMSHAIQAVSTERGRDIRNFLLLAFGGSGPVHAALLAKSLGISKIVIPPAPGLFSSFGLLVAPHCYEFMAGFMQKSGEITVSSLIKAFKTLESTAANVLKEEGYHSQSLSFVWEADMHYVGQNHELSIVIPPDITINDLEEAFHEEHEITYSYRSETESTEITNIRIISQDQDLSIRGKTTTNIAKYLYQSTMDSHKQERKVFFGKTIGHISTPLVTRKDLTSHAMNGPMILDEYDTTIVVPPHCSVYRDNFWNVILEWR